MRRYQRILRYLAAQRIWLAAVAVLTVLSATVVALQPWPVKLLVDYALGDQPLPAGAVDLLQRFGLDPGSPALLVILAAAATLALFVVETGLSAGLAVSWTMAGQRAAYAVAADVFARLQRLSLRFHSRLPVGDSLSRLDGDTWAVYSVANLLMKPLQSVVTVLAMGAVGFALDPLLAVLCLVAAPLLAASARFFGKRLKRKARQRREASSRIASFVQQTLSSMPMVQAFGTEERNRRSFQDLADEAVEIAQRGRLVASSFGLANGLILTAGTAFVLFVGGSRVLSGAIPLGTLLVFMRYVRKMQEASGSLFTVFAKLKEAEASLDRLMEILESDDEIREVSHPKALPAIGPTSGKVVLEGVSVGYESGHPVLENIHLEAMPGEVVAVVGATGAGKSTLLSLIPRFVDPWQGTVFVDGLDVRTTSLESLRSRVSLVLQETILPPLSVAETIAYGRPDAGRREIVAAATAARADEFVRRLPEGYDSIVGERGSKLSGGERQRLAIARALLRDTPILILDEPTSALDVQTEAELLAALETLMAGRTTFVVAHRLSTVRNADRIAVLDGGRIAELGSHSDLMQLRGVYHRLYTSQALAPGREQVA